MRMVDVFKEEDIISRLLDLPTYTRTEMKALSGIATEEEFDIFLADLEQRMLPGLQILNAGTQRECYHLPKPNFSCGHCGRFEIREVAEWPDGGESVMAGGQCYHCGCGLCEACGAPGMPGQYIETEDGELLLKVC
jgi:hypothetical protein